MKFLDKIALNRLIKIITNFILGLIKIFKPENSDILPPIPTPRKRPLKDLLDRIFK